MKAGASVLREATIPMSLFSRSAFGVGLSLLRAEDERGHCPCSLLDAGEPPPEECRSFRVGLFAENQDVSILMMRTNGSGGLHACCTIPDYDNTMNSGCRLLLQGIFHDLEIFCICSADWTNIRWIVA